MSDLISRQAAIAALMNSELGSWNNDDYERGARAQHLDDVAAIKSVPSVRKKRKPPAQPEIIRSKDCKHWTNNIGDSKLRDNYCNDEAHGFYYQCSEDDYCSFAERRTDEQTVS